MPFKREWILTVSQWAAVILECVMAPGRRLIEQCSWWRRRASG
jgi:hypothetical protein